MPPGLEVDGTVQLSVVIPTFNRADRLAQTLRHLARQEVDATWEVVVVNNGGTDGTDGLVAELSGGFPVALRLVRQGVPGASAARNHGLRAASGDAVVLVDDDILLGPGQLQRALADHRSRPAAWWVGQVWPLPEHLSTPFGAYRAACMPPTPLSRPVEAVDWYASGLAVVPRLGLLALGGYNEDFHTAGLEDGDLFIRARRAGIDVLFDPRLIGLHNDWAGRSLRDFCDRQRAHCRTAHLLEERFGQERHPWSSLIEANRPAPPGGIDIRKTAKALWGRPLPFALLLAVTGWLERRPALRRTSWPCYRVAIGAAMYQGYQQGLAARRSHPAAPRVTASPAR